MRRRFHRSSSLIVALTLTMSLVLPVAAAAQTEQEGPNGPEAQSSLVVAQNDPDDKDRTTFALGRFRDRSDWGDFSSLLTQSLAVLALTRAEDVAPSAAAVDLLVAHQCDDGGFPDVFAPPSTEGPAPCVSAVDTTAFVIQALDAAGAAEPAARAVDWLLAEQADDGSFGAADGTNTNTTGLAAVALALSGHEQAAAAARTWIASQQLGCQTDSPGMIPFNLEEHGVAEMSTAQALLGLTGTGLADVHTADVDPELPDDPCAEDPGVIDETNSVEAATLWLASVLTEEPGVDTGFGASEGATIDAMLGFAATGTAGTTIEAMADWLETRVAPYTQGQGFDAADAVYAGATAKLLLGMDAVVRDPRNVAGTDLVAQLLSTEVTDLAPVDLACDADAGAEPDATVVCTLEGLLFAETVHVLVEVNPVLLDNHVTADQNGAASFEFTVPDDVTDGDTIAITVAGVGAPNLATHTLPVEVAAEDEDDADGGNGDDNEVDNGSGPGTGDDPQDAEEATDDQDAPDDQPETDPADGFDADDALTTPVDPADDAAAETGGVPVASSASGRDTLPETGADTGWLALLAAASLVSGLVLIRCTPRVRTTR